MLLTTIPTMRTLKVKPLAMSTIVRIGRMTMNDKGRFHEKKLLVFFYFSCASCPNWGEGAVVVEGGGNLDKIQKNSNFFS